MLRWARALPRWMCLLPGVLWKPLVGAVGRSLVVERRFSFLFEFVLEVELILKFFKRLLPTLESHHHATKHLLSTQGSTRAWGRVQLRPQDSQRRQTHVSCRAT